MTCDPTNRAIAAIPFTLDKMPVIPRVSPAFIVIAAVGLLGGTQLLASEPILLKPAQVPGTYQQAKVVVEVEGSLRINADGSEVKHLPMKVEANLSYVERTLIAEPGLIAARVARHYRDATAVLQLRDAKIESKLREDRRLIVAQSSASEASIFSPLGPLERDELDLLDVPGACLPLGALLPREAVSVGSTWKVSNEAAGRLFGLEAVNDQDLTATLTKVEDNLAIITLTGKVAGAVGGVSTEIEAKGSLNFDLQQRAVTWLALAYQEKRAIGHAQPGFEVTGKVRWVAGPITKSEELADSVLRSLPTTSGPATTLVEFRNPQAGIQVAHDRRWRVMVERRELTVLRLIDRGDLIAQCNISPLPELPAGEQLTLEGFQADVKQTLGKNFGEIVEASQEVTDAGQRILRVVVAGTASELPIQWSYYHVSNNAGRRVALVFTLESSLVERFPQVDRELIDSLSFIELPSPTPADPTEPQPADAKVQSASKAAESSVRK
jgi:hypothetical protein